MSVESKGPRTFLIEFDGSFECEEMISFKNDPITIGDQFEVIEKSYADRLTKEVEFYKGKVFGWAKHHVGGESAEREMQKYEREFKKLLTPKSEEA